MLAVDTHRRWREALSNALNAFSGFGRHPVPPDPGILKAIGLNHGLESAIADLVDNSIDAHATRVLIRFVLRDGRATQLLVVDNGDGMDGDEVDAAMTLGKPKPLGQGTQGHFGVGLKSASFSQASELTVLTRRAGGPAQGRRLMRESRTPSFEVELLDSDEVGAALDTIWPDFKTQSGTIVRWDQIRTFPASSDPSVTRHFLDSSVTGLKNHLGLVFHRLLRPRSLSIEVDVYDADEGEPGLPFPIDPLDPFGYPRSGDPEYPQTLVAHCRNKSIPIRCHIWPARSDSHLFKLAGAPVDRFQGFYLYRSDRLLSTGQWLGAAREDKRRRLARVAVDIDDHLDVFSMSAEKSGVHMAADLVHAVEQAISADGVTFAGYLACAEEVFRKSNRRVRVRAPILPPGQGISPRVKQALSREAALLEGEEAIRIRWKFLVEGDFVRVDRKNRTLLLNSEYREAVLKGTPGSVNDAPLLKALLFLLYEDIFHGSFYGPKDKDNVSLWLEVLTAAAEEERREYYK